MAYDANLTYYIQYILKSNVITLHAILQNNIAYTLCAKAYNILSIPSRYLPEQQLAPLPDILVEEYAILQRSIQR